MIFMQYINHQVPREYTLRGGISRTQSNLSEFQQLNLKSVCICESYSCKINSERDKLCYSGLCYFFNASHLAINYL